ncbi:Glyceraldehyde-3-phosphate dehydrogenase-like family protein [Hibiscus syriacus]|uniref:Glyceraldehyde-3-phosphate dehydrogenase-like family protein n=1 Tax=Hibiscus syriacus TaxID=106335 RepID=A0A6A3D1C7_HIBSY|nr:Glyceraldehyde-3-phosphate dehydrogenase-like family protein [Hibiscus syriacus]
MSSMDQLQQSAVTATSTNATLTGMMIAGWGWVANLIVYLVGEFNFKSIDATQVANVVNGSINLIPIIGAVLADSFLGSFRVVSISILSTLLGIIILTLIATLSYLRPHCETGLSLCYGPSKIHLAVLYSAITLASIGLGMASSMLRIVLVGDWDLEFVRRLILWVCLFSCWEIVSTAMNKPQGSPYTSLARVIVAAIRKRKLLVSTGGKDYHHEINDRENKDIATMPKRSFRFLNHAAMKTEGDINSDGLIAKPWRLCSVQQVEDLKTLIIIFPVFASTVLLCTPLAVQTNMTVLQAIAMDRHLGSNFKIPAGSIAIVGLISSATFIALLDRFLYPNWKNLTGRWLTPLQKLGTGHVFNTLSMAMVAVVGSERLKKAHNNHLQGQQGGAVVPMLALWLFPQLIVVGMGEAFHFPWNVSLYCQEFPVSMKNAATSMISIAVGIAFYVSAASVGLIRNVTGWLPNDINEGRLDNVYWTFMLLGLLNFGYFLVCAKFYRYQQ